MQQDLETKYYKVVKVKVKVR